MGDSYIQTGRNYKGLLDDVRLYSRVLSASEVAALVTEGPGLPAENLQISVPGSGEIVVLSWTGEYGKPYGVETNSNLVIGDWQLFSTVIGDGVMSSATNVIGPTQTFYRVIPE